MFGSLGAFVNGTMFAGLFGTDVGVKLDEASRAERARTTSPPAPQEQRPKKKQS